jgi:hypothetical protein
MKIPRLASERPDYGATALRLQWADLPADVRGVIDARVGADAAASASSGSGFTTGFAARVKGASGKCFVKAVDAKASPWIAQCYRREAEINTLLPEAVPAPRLDWIEERKGWVVLGFALVDGGRMPSQPWREGELSATLAAYATAAQALDPAPAPLLGAGLKPIAADGDFDHWRTLAGGSGDLAALPGFVPPGLITPLAGLERGWAKATAGGAVLHHDLRADNILLDAAGGVWICDWNWPVLAAGWFDLSVLLAVAHADGHDASGLFAAQPVAAGVEPEQLDAALAALAGYFVVHGAKPSLAASPHLRAHQTYCGEAVLRWLADRRGWQL